jgi:hypothetical protein
VLLECQTADGNGVEASTGRIVEAGLLEAGAGQKYRRAINGIKSRTLSGQNGIRLNGWKIAKLFLINYTVFCPIFVFIPHIQKQSVKSGKCRTARFQA